MKKIIYLLLILNLGLLSCVDDASVRVMPEFNCKDTKVNLAKAAGSSVTSLLYTNVGQVVAQYQAEWLSVDVNAKSVIYTALTQNDGEDARSTVVKLTCGSYTVEVTVTQDSKEPDLSLKVGQSVDDGIGMIFWVDPSDKMVGKAVSVKRQGGNPFEASVFPLFPSIHFLWHSLQKFLNQAGDNRYSAQSSACFPEKSLDLFKNLSIPFIKFLSYWVQRQ